MTNFSPKYLSSFVNDVEEWGVKVGSERGDTLEIEDEILHLKNPLDRVCTERWRKMNIGFAIVDALSHIMGDTKLQPLLNFVPGFSKFSTNGKTIDGAYGERINTGDQMELAIKMLKENPQTRRAVISIYMGVVDLNGGGGLNTPCTLNFHFLVREGKLNMKVMMRSNDIILGLTNDIFTFTFLHEFVSMKTGIPLGRYTHYASSLHLYTSDLKKFPNIEHGGNWPDMMWKMPDDFEPMRVYEPLSRLHKMSFEHCLDFGLATLDSQYERNLYFAAASVYFRKDPQVDTMVTLCYDECLRRVVEFWTERKEVA